MNQYNTFKQNLEKQISVVDKKIPDVGGLVNTTLNTKNWEVENKKPGVSGLVEKSDYSAEISDIEEKYS